MTSRLINILYLCCFVFLISLSACSLFGTSKDDSDKEEVDEGYGSDFSEIELYSEAIKSFDAERYSVSRKLFEKLAGKFPSSPLSVYSELKLADSIFFSERYLDSVPYYKEFIRVNNSHEAIPYSYNQIADAYLLSYKGVGFDVTPLYEAKKIYQKIINDYENTRWEDKARKKIFECDELLFDSEINVVKFYEKKGQNKAARSRLDEVSSKYSHIKEIKEINDSSSEISKIDNYKNDVQDELDAKFLRFAKCRSRIESTELELMFGTKPHVLRSDFKKIVDKSQEAFQNLILISSTEIGSKFSEFDDFSEISENTNSDINFKVCGKNEDKLYVYEFKIVDSDNNSEDYIVLKFNSFKENNLKLSIIDADNEAFQMKLLFSKE